MVGPPAAGPERADQPDAPATAGAACGENLPLAAAAESAARVAAAYDAVAAEYDGLVREDAWMRQRLWAHYRRAFGRGARVLDVACGTGLDTLHLAALGRRMTGVDVSPGMLAEDRKSVV